LKDVLARIEKEMLWRVAYFEKAWLFAEAQRLKKRVSYDIKMIQETWFVNGIENYSPYFENRLDGWSPNTLFDYFPDDFLLIVDESHMTLPQFWWMPRADTSRKQSLIDHGFRLPSAIHHRPLNFDELSVKMWWKWRDEVSVHENLKESKQHVDTLYVSATPSSYELAQSQRIVQQVIRPTGLLDPITYVYPKSWNYDHLLTSVDRLMKDKPDVLPFMESYDQEIHPWLF
jgi:excinuclease ABC subunit B